MRRFGVEISGNRRRGGELSEEQRVAILYGLQSKQSPTQIAHQLRVSRRVIYTTRDRYLNHQTVVSKPRSGRPSKLNAAAKRYIYLMARRRPQMTYKALAATSSPPISKRTIQRILRKYNLKKWKSKQRIPLTKEAAKARFEFVKRWRNNTQILEILYSDECSVQRKPNNTVKFVFRYQYEAFRSDLVNLRNHGKDISQMVWGAIWHGGRSEIVIMKRDNEARRGGYSTNSYIKCLEEGLIPIYEPGALFQQDNARIHISTRMQEWFENHGIWVMEWPPHSPDLNPIEHCWNLLKKKLMELYPCLFMGGRSQIDWTQFHEAIQAAWWAIPQATIDALIDSIPRRLEAVYQVRGWYTKY